MDVQKYELSSLFNPSRKDVFTIPVYQREYVWGHDNWEKLFDDIDDPSVNFLGSFICINKNNGDSLASPEFEIVDGQQRLTTISILLMSIYEKLVKIQQNHNGESSEKLITLKNNLKNSLLYEDGNNWMPKLIPSEQGENKKAYGHLNHLVFNDDVAEITINHFGNRLFGKARAYFSSRIKDYDFDQIEDLYKKINITSIVKIQVGSNADAFVMFETLNNRGFPLSIMDIIKNALFAKLDKPNKNLEPVFNKWVDMTARIKGPEAQERFLRHYYNMFYHAGSSEHKDQATKSSIIGLYEKIVQSDADTLFKELIKKSYVYAALNDWEMAKNKWGGETGKTIRDLNLVKAAPAHAYLLWLVDLCEKRKWKTQDAVKDMASFLAKWFCWRNLTNYPGTNILDKMFIDLVSDIKKQIDSEDIKKLKDVIDCSKLRLSKEATPKKLCEEELSKDVYRGRTDICRFILGSIEKHNASKESDDIFRVDDKGKPHYTIEHIAPQSLSKDWLIMLNIPENNTEDFKQEYLHRLGNLTLSAYNTPLGNKSFKVKCDRKDKKGNHIGYKNGLKLNSEIEPKLSEQDDWTQDKIKERTENLTKIALEVLDVWEQ